MYIGIILTKYCCNPILAIEVDSNFITFLYNDGCIDKPTMLQVTRTRFNSWCTQILKQIRNNDKSKFSSLNTWCHDDDAVYYNILIIQLQLALKSLPLLLYTNNYVLYSMLNGRLSNKLAKMSFMQIQ